MPIHLTPAQRLAVTRAARVALFALIASGIVERVLAGSANRAAIAAAVAGALEAGFRILVPATPDRMTPPSTD